MDRSVAVAPLGPASPALRAGLRPVADATGLPDGPSLRSGSGPATTARIAAMPTTHTTRSTANTATAERRTGQRVQLATYSTDTGERRVLVGQRVDGIVRVTDEPAHGDGRRYLVEPQLESKAALDALVDDYLAKAKRVGYPPMHGWF